MTAATEDKQKHEARERARVNKGVNMTAATEDKDKSSQLRNYAIKME